MQGHSKSQPSAVGRLRPDEAAVPGRTLRHVRHAVVAYADAHQFAGDERPRQVDGELALRIAPVDQGEWLAVDVDRVDRQVAVEVQVDAVQRRGRAEGQQRIAADAAAGRIDAQRQIGMLEGQRPLFGTAFGAGGQGLGAQRGLAGAGAQQCAGEDNDVSFHGRSVTRRNGAPLLPPPVHTIGFCK
jgi:hypothetical protein